MDVRVDFDRDHPPVVYPPQKNDRSFNNTVSNARMKLQSRIPNTIYEFRPVELVFETDTYIDVFGNKNNKTLSETLAHRRYAKLKQDAEDKYSKFLAEPLGEFLLALKISSDDFYQKFLNKYGDERYSRFRIVDPDIFNRRGVYTYTMGDELMYVGRCRDSMRTRINQGYGTIHPKNCFIDGQATNCHLNALITTERDKIGFGFCELPVADIVEVEKNLITEYTPAWNIKL